MVQANQGVAGVGGVTVAVVVQYGVKATGELSIIIPGVPTYPAIVDVHCGYTAMLLCGYNKSKIATVTSLGQTESRMPGTE